MKLNWSARHVGLDAADLGEDPLLACWTLIRRVVASEFGRMLPAASPGVWRLVEPEDATDFDLLVFGYGGMDTHLGLVVTDAADGRRRMLHLPEDDSEGVAPLSVVEDYDCDPWRKVLKGVYRLAPEGTAEAQPLPPAVPDSVLLVGRPFITQEEERTLVVAPGETLGELVKKLYPAAFGAQLDRMRVTLDGASASPQMIPPAGSVVLVEPLPGAFGLRSWLQIGVAIAAITAATLIGGPFGAVASAAITIGGNVAINAFAPAELAGKRGIERSPTYDIQGWANVANPDGAFPALLGAHRVAPVLLAQTYARYSASPIGLNWKGEWTTSTSYVENDGIFHLTGAVFVLYGCLVDHVAGALTEPGVGANWETVWEVVAYNADQWNYFLGCGGFGPQSVPLSSLRIGETKIFKPEAEWANPDVPETYFGDDIEIEIREGYPDDEPISIYPGQVFEDILSIELPNGRDAAIEPTVRRTLTDVTGVQNDYFFPEGLIELDASSSHNDPKQVQITNRYRAVGDTGWSAPIVLYWDTERQEAFGHTQWIPFPVRGPAYDVETLRSPSSIDDADDTVLDRVDWVSMKSIRPEYPIAFDKPLVLIAVKIRASHQLAGRLDQLNYDGQLLCQDWDADTETWIVRATSNPASLARWILQGPARAEPDADSALKLSRFQYWHEQNAALGLRYDYVHDTFQDWPQALAQVAAAGNAVVWHDGSQWDVAIDEPQTVVCGLVTLRNGGEIKSSRPREKLADALIVPFRNRLDGYAEAERIVPFPGDVRHDTLEDLEADLDWPAGTKGEALGVIYLKSGASGAGSWAPYSLDLVERWERPGLTHPDEVWLAARREQWIRKLRRRRLSASLEGFDAMTLRPGNLIRLDRGRPVLGVITARVRGVSPEGIVWTDEIIEQVADGDYEISWRSLPSEGSESADDPPSLLITRPVITVPGSSRSVMIGAGSLPAVDDLLIFGPVGGTGTEAIIAGVDLGDRERAMVQLYDHRPEIADYIAAEVPSTWTPRVVGVVLDFLTDDEDVALTDDKDKLLLDEAA